MSSRRGQQEKVNKTSLNHESASSCVREVTILTRVQPYVFYYVAYQFHFPCEEHVQNSRKSKYSFSETKFRRKKIIKKKLPLQDPFIPKQKHDSCHLDTQMSKNHSPPFNPKIAPLSLLKITGKHSPNRWQGTRVVFSDVDRLFVKYTRDEISFA